MHRRRPITLFRDDSRHPAPLKTAATTNVKRALLLGALLVMTLCTSAGASAQNPCTDGASGYADTLIEIGDDLTEASTGTSTDVLQAADAGFETLAMIEPPTAFEEQHSYMLSALHNLAMAGLAEALGQPTVAESYADAAQQRLAQFEETFPAALASCGG